MFTAIPGPKSAELRQREDRLLAPGIQNLSLLAGIVLEKGKGCHVWDVDGNRFLDMIGGIGVNGLGHSHPKFVEAIQSQVAELAIGSFTSEARLRFFERLEKYHPEKGEYRIQLYSSGAEAVESALRLAKSFTGKYEFVSFTGGFHGKTLGALSLMGSTFKQGLGPLVPGNHVVPYASCYRCPVKLTPETCTLECVDLAKQQLQQNSTGRIAAIIVEPIQGTAGNVIPPSSWLQEVRALADEQGALLISDEMITGFGRTGKFWGWEHAGVKPDVITMGKQFGGGFPVSAVLARKDIAQAKPWANPSGSSSSYGGNPLASAAADATLKIIEEEQLVDRSRNRGEFFLSRLQELERKHDCIGHVSGKGLLIGVQLVENRKTKAPLPKETCLKIFNACLQRGLLTMAYAPNFRLQPPMVVEESEIEEAVAILDAALTEVTS